MAKRERLRSTLALAIIKTMGVGHKLTISNAIRFVKPLLPQFNIRRAQEITIRDWEISLHVVSTYQKHRIGRSNYYRELERIPHLKDRLNAVLRSLKNL